METASIKLTVAEQIFGANKAPVEEVLAAEFAELAAEVERAVKAVTDRPAKIKDDVDFAATGSLANRVSALSKRLETTRKGETDPLYKAQKEVKSYFDLLAEQLTNAIKPHIDAANSYTRAKQAEANRLRQEEERKLREKAAAEAEKANTSENTGVAARAEGRAEAFSAQADKLAGAGTSAADAVRTKVAGGGVATARTFWNFRVADYAVLDLNQLRDFIPQEDIDKAIRSKVRVQKGNTKINGVEVFEDTQAQFRS